MSAAAASASCSERPHRTVRWPGWYKYLRTELAPLPNRGDMTLRLVIVNVVITLLSMTLRIPGLGVTAYVATLVTKDNQASTTKTGVAITIGVFLACVISLYAYHFTLDYPAIRLAFMVGMIYTGMFVLRASTLGFLGWAAAFFAALIQGNADAAPLPDQVVRGTLYFGMYFFYPVAVVLFVNRVLLPSRPREELVHGLRHRLDLAIETLGSIAWQGMAGGRDDLAARARASRGVTAGLGTLAQAESDSPELKAHHDALMAAIVAGTRVAKTTGDLAARQPVTLTTEDRRSVEAVLAECRRLREAVDGHGAPPSEQEIVGFPTDPDIPELAELQGAVTALRVSLNIAEPTDAEPAPAPKKTFLKKDAFTNADYSHYALKTTLATVLCYVLYNAIQWPGLSTALFTCTVITFEGHNEGSVHKGLLRIGGCCAGGLIGFMAVTFLFPHMTSVGSLCLLSAAVTACGGWIASGGENTAYFGGQLVYAFYIGIDQGFAPNVDYSDMRNRFMGILLGLCVSAWIYANLWPQRAVDRVRASAAKTLRDLARLLLIPHPDQPLDKQWREARQVRQALPKDLDTALRLAELSEDESDESNLASEGLCLAVLPELMAQTQAVFLIANLLTTHEGIMGWDNLSASTRAAEYQLRERASDRLCATADLVETGRRTDGADLEVALAAWREHVAEEPSKFRVLLLERLVAREKQLQEL